MSELPYIQQTNDRRLDAGYQGDILVWDIDKTYLDTRFETLRGLLAIPFEAAVDKKSIPGAATLLRSLRRGASEENALVPLYFISGSPLQLRKVIEKKMLLDGVEFDGITFKDQWGLLRAGRPRLIKAQLQYKLKALLLYRREMPDGARWLLFGDDAEVDAEAFVLFGEIVGGLRGDHLTKRLRTHRLPEDIVGEIVRLASTLPEATNPVERIFIHLDRGRSPDSFTQARVVATRSYIQTALLLAAMGRISPDGVTAVAKDMRRRMVSETEIASHLLDAERRLFVPVNLTDLARR